MADRLQKLKTLEALLQASMDECDSKSMAAIARQYRETIREIDELEGADAADDSITEILAARKAHGSSTAERADSSEV